VAADDDWRVGRPEDIPNDRNQVNFRAFVAIFNKVMGKKRHEQRLMVKSLFEKLQRDPTGLSRIQMHKMVKRCTKQLMLLEPAFDIEQDWKLMLQLSGDDTSARTVVFSQFERWWKYRMGLMEADTPVIPEFFTWALSNIAQDDKRNHQQQQYKQQQDRRNEERDHAALDAKSGAVRARSASEQDLVQQLQETSKTRSGKELFALLRPRLQLLSTARRDWGTISDVYGHCESNYTNVPLPWYIRDPESSWSFIWDSTQVIFLFYVAFTVPAYACFGVDVKILSMKWFVETLIDIYFILDVGLNFFTACDKSNGMREANLRGIARNYLMSWFAIDFISCIPVQYVQYVASDRTVQQGTSANNSSRALKTLRLIRLSKMLRLFRLQVLAQVTSPMRMLYTCTCSTVSIDHTHTAWNDSFWQCIH
jgi:hypothetical protein